MKQLGKSKDQAIGNLLRAHISKPSNPHEACKQFDPDLANAYVERKMTGPSRAGYETHLSECAPCRQSVVALARFAAAERAPLSTPVAPARASWLESLRSVVRTLSGPQWAMAAAAVVVFAISLPLLLSRNQTDRALPANSVSETRADETTQAEPHQVSPAASVSPATSASNKSDDVKQGNKPESNGLLAANNPREDRALSGELKKTASENAPQTGDETQRKNESQTVAQPPPQAVQAAPDAQAKLDSDRTREQQEKDAAQPKPAPADEQSADKEKSRRAELAAAPPAPPASSGSGRLRPPSAKLGLRDSNASESVRPRSDYRELRGKKFFLIDGTWTDKDYSADKDLPTITLVRDSNVYKELLAKRASLKPYLSFFTETERAIIVYKGTVYKLIPQQ